MIDELKKELESLADKKYQIFSKAADAFLNLIQQDLNKQ